MSEGRQLANAHRTWQFRKRMVMAHPCRSKRNTSPTAPRQVSPRNGETRAGMDSAPAASYLQNLDLFQVCVDSGHMLKDNEERPSGEDESEAEVEIRMTRFVLGEIRRYVMITTGLVLLISGMIVLPLPIPFGLAMILIGLSILIVNSPFLRSRFLDLRRRWTRMDDWISSVEHRLPGPVRRAIRPDESD